MEQFFTICHILDAKSNIINDTKTGHWDIDDVSFTSVEVRKYGNDVNLFFPESIIGNKQFLDEFSDLPLYDGHGKGCYGNKVSNHIVGRASERKQLGSIRGGTAYYDRETQTVKGSIRIVDETTLELIKSGKKQVSIGWLPKMKNEIGNYNGKEYNYILDDLHPNHIALARQGRAKNNRGEPMALVLDSEDFNEESQELPNANVNLTMILTDDPTFSLQ